MDSIEVEGKTYEEAVRKAAMALNAEEKDLDIEVTEVDTKGILGLLGSKKIRIVARLRPRPCRRRGDTGGVRKEVPHGGRGFLRHLSAGRVENRR